jgi:hypothetical protein
MWNNINYVAIGRFLPEQELLNFAVKNADKYGIDVVTPTHVLVNTWYVDQMCEDFRNEFPELCEQVRAEKVAVLHKENQNV